MGFNKKDHILHKRGLLSQKDCNFLINWFEERTDLHERGTVDGNLYETPDEKQDTEIYLNTSKNFSLICSNCLNYGIEEYKKKYRFINQVRTFNIHSVYKMQRYLPGEGYFTLHCENDGPDFTGESSEMLILAWMIYLNDVTDGGYTEFPSQNKKFQPRRGDVLIWPAYFTHPHRGIVSKTQVKYILTGWYALKH